MELHSFTSNYCKHANTVSLCVPIVSTNCCHICLDRVQNLSSKFFPFYFLFLTEEKLSLTLFYHYFYDRCSAELQSDTPLPKCLQQILIYLQLSTFYLCLKLKKISMNGDFILEVLWNVILWVCFPADYKMVIFKSSVNKFLLSSIK